VRLGAARFIDQPVALASLAVMWALLMPVSDRLDGVTCPPDHA
jgi:hypothetical protein